MVNASTYMEMKLRKDEEQNLGRRKKNFLRSAKWRDPNWMNSRTSEWEEIVREEREREIQSKHMCRARVCVWEREREREREREIARK